MYNGVGWLSCFHKLIWLPHVSRFWLRGPNFSQYRVFNISEMENGFQVPQSPISKVVIVDLIFEQLHEIPSKMSETGISVESRGVQLF